MNMLLSIPYMLAEFKPHSRVVVIKPCEKLPDIQYVAAEQLSFHQLMTSKIKLTKIQKEKKTNLRSSPFLPQQNTDGDSVFVSKLCFIHKLVWA